MDETVKAIVEHGVLILIAAIFLWEKVAYSKTVKAVLDKLQSSISLQDDTLRSLQRVCDNQSTSLNMLQNTLAAMRDSMERHDKRSEHIANDCVEIKAVLATRPCAK